MDAVVLAAGEGTRLRPLTEDKPKGMVEIDDQPLLTHCFDQVIDLGAERLVVVVGYMKEKIIDHYGDEYRDVPITYTHQREQLGLAHAILQAEPHVDGAFMLMLGDSVFRGNLGDVASRRKKTAPTLRSSSRRSRTRRPPATTSSTPTSTARSSRSSRSPTTRRATSS
jgi:glucose-1-phosphate thymidylyltransferase